MNDCLNVGLNRSAKKQSKLWHMLAEKKLWMCWRLGAKARNELCLRSEVQHTCKIPTT